MVMTDQLDLKARPDNSAEDALPLPLGTVIYESLTCKFISFERMLESLGETRYSGFVRIAAPRANGVLLFREGTVLDCIHRGDEGLISGSPALTSIERHVAAGSGVIDVVGVSSELVDGLHHLASGVATYPELRASWINAPGLVRFLSEAGFTGAISIRTKAAAGVIMIAAGVVTGAFTTESREMGSDPEVVLNLCSDPNAQIEVRASRAQPEAVAPGADEWAANRAGAEVLVAETS